MYLLLKSKHGGIEENWTKLAAIFPIVSTDTVPGIIPQVARRVVRFAVWSASCKPTICADSDYICNGIDSISPLVVTVIIVEVANIVGHHRKLVGRTNWPGAGGVDRGG